MTQRNEFKLGALLSYASMIFNAAAGILYTPWIIRSIGTAEYGLYTLSLSLVNMFLIDFGLGQTVVRYLARYYARNDENSVPRFLGMVYKIYLLVAFSLLIIYLSIYLALGRIYTSLSPSELTTLKPLFLVSALYSVSLFPCMPLEGVLTARERFVALNGCTLAWRVTTVVLTICALQFGLGVYSLVLVNAISGFIFALLKYICVQRLTTDRADFTGWDGKLGRDILGFTSWQMIAQVAENVTTTITPSILAATTGAASVTIIGVAIQVNGYVYQIASVINRMLTASTARLIEHEDSTRLLQKQLETVGRFQLVSMGLVYVLFASVGDRIIECWLGSGYDDLLVCILMVLLPTLLRMCQSIADTALMLQGNVKERGGLGMLMLVVTVFIALMASPICGAAGAALGLCVGGIVRAAGLQRYSSRLLGISSKHFIVSTLCRWIGPALVAIAAGAFGSLQVSSRGWLPLCGLALAVVSLYVLICWLIAFDRDDRERVKSLIIGR